jgi:magnesium transporter
MIRALYFTPTGETRTDLQPKDYPAALRNARGVLWVDFECTPAEEDEPILRDVFRFHPLAVDDALQETHLPKVDDWEKYLYIVLEALAFERGEGSVELIELDVFLGKNYIVTHHDLPIVALDRLWTACHQHERHMKAGADHILCKLADELTVDYMQIVEEMDEEIEWIEDQVFEKPSAEMVQRIFLLKRATMHLRRAVSPMREVLNKLARDSYDVIDSKDRVYFRDVYDHLVRLHDITEGLRDLVGGALDTYLSVVNNRMNDIMKTLTLITTLFMPISFVAGFFGMNFFQPVSVPLKAWTSDPAFILTMVLIILTPIGMYSWMRRRGWM